MEECQGKDLRSLKARPFIFSISLWIFFSTSVLAPPAAQGMEVTSARTGNLFVRGERIDLEVKDAKKQFRVTVTRATAEGTDQVFEGAFESEKDGGTTRIILPLNTAELPNGLYVVAVDGRPARQFGVVPPVLGTNTGSLPLLGVSLYYLDLYGDGTDLMDLKEGIKTIELLKRLRVQQVLVSVDWYRIEPTKGVYQWENMDRQVELLHQAGIYIVGQLAFTPQWASSCPQDTEEDSLGLGMPGYRLCPPTDMGDWRTFVSQVAARYKGKIDAYEVWNEPDDVAEDNRGTSYRGSVEKFIAIVKGASRAIRKEAPGTQILVSAFVRSDLDFARTVWQATIQDFDVASLHYQAVARTLDYSQPILNALDPHKPIWDTEEGGTGFLDFEGASPIKNIVECLASGLDHILMFALGDYSAYFPETPGGLLNERLEVTARALHFRTAADLLRDVKFEGQATEGGIHQYWFRKKDGTRLLVAWALEGYAELALEQTPERVVDAWGNEVPIEGPVLQLDTSPVFIESNHASRH